MLAYFVNFIHTKCTKCLLCLASFIVLSFFCLSPQLLQWYLMEITSFSQSYNHGKNKNMFSRRPQQCINTLFACFITSLEVCTYMSISPKCTIYQKSTSQKKRRGRSDERTSKKSQPPTKLLNLSR